MFSIRSDTLPKETGKGVFAFEQVVENFVEVVEAVENSPHPTPTRWLPWERGR